MNNNKKYSYCTKYITSLKQLNNYLYKQQDNINYF